MKPFILPSILFLLVASLIGCTSKKESSAIQKKAITFPERAKSMNIYEVNIRQYTPEGTLNAFAQHMPRLKDMGVDILWIMPVQPISEKNRKGTLGSYYSIQDYTAVNPDFGSLEDFKALVEKAHDLDMLVILDWVANHTGFDHTWTTMKEYYVTDSLGNIISPNPDWTDVAELNYENLKMRDDMLTAMKWWIGETDIDGFRCDVAGEVPLDFWKTTIDSLKKEKDLFMLAEWDEPDMHTNGFHMTYGWGPHHAINSTASGQYNADSLEHEITQDINRYPLDAFRMMFTTNHDENSWNGTVFERLGEGHKAFAVYCFTINGMPLLYSGQEAGLNKRLRFFEKDTIDWSEIRFGSFYKKLISLKKDNPALHNGIYGGKPQFVADNNADVMTFKKEKDGNQVIAVLNLSNENQQISIQDADLLGVHTDYFDNVEVTISKDEPLQLNPYQFYIFTQEAK